MEHRRPDGSTTSTDAEARAGRALVLHRKTPGPETGLPSSVSRSSNAVLRLRLHAVPAALGDELDPHGDLVDECEPQSIDRTIHLREARRHSKQALTRTECGAIL